MNFILDGMLGKLTRWLRMMGHDVKYSTELSDPALLALAKKESRILLTRDFSLYEQAIGKGIEALYVEGATEPQRLAELTHRFGIKLEIDLEKSRCPKCNAKLMPVPKNQIADKVEKNTLLHYDAFWLCPNCGSVYWQGAHWVKIAATLQKAKEETKKRV